VVVGPESQHRAYDGLAAGWDRAAGPVYRPLALALVAASPAPLRGRPVLDVGSGTGAVAEAAEAAGAGVVTADLSNHMVAFGGSRWPAVVADVVALPFCDGSFFAALAGFVVNHVHPERALREMARVVGPGGVVLASTWTGGVSDPVKAAIDGVLARWGWVPPPWYQAMKADIEPISGDPARLASAAEEVGLVDVIATSRRVDLGSEDPEIAVEYRLALPHVVPWVSVLDPRTRADVRRDAVAALGVFPGRWCPSVIVLVGRRAQPRRRAQRSRAGA
jgi:SAM-dependent methyltransferase